jgi:hypothetical protein
MIFGFIHNSFALRYLQMKKMVGAVRFELTTF